MSFRLKKTDLEKEHKNYIKETCKIYEKETLYNTNPQCLTIYTVDKNEVIIPLALWKDFLDDFPNNNDYSTFKINFDGEPQENNDRDQKTILNQSLTKLEKDHYVFLALRTGFGKTFCSLWLICKLGLKAIILCHSNTLHEQWKNEAEKYCPDLKIQIVKNKKLNPLSHVYIMGVQKSSHYDREKFKDIGLVLVDEAHLTYTLTFTDALSQFEPKYIIGLSATPDRKSGMDNLLYPFFGPKDEFIIRKQKKEMIVLKIKTKFQPNISYMMTKIGPSLNWSDVINSIAYNDDRLKYIANLIDSFYKGTIEGSEEENKDKKILVLCNRVGTIEGIKAKYITKGLLYYLKKLNITSDYASAKKKEFDETVKVLLGTIDKFGVGYDSDRDVLILEVDTQDVRQAEGRIRKNNSLIIDIVDDYGIFEKHWKTRSSWYLQRGGIIKK